CWPAAAGYTQVHCTQCRSVFSKVGDRRVGLSSRAEVSVRGQNQLSFHVYPGSRGRMASPRRANSRSGAPRSRPHGLAGCSSPTQEYPRAPPTLHEKVEKSPMGGRPALTLLTLFGIIFCPKRGRGAHGGNFMHGAGYAGLANKANASALPPRSLLGWLPFLWSQVLFAGGSPSPRPFRLWNPFFFVLLPALLLYGSMSFPLFEPDEGRYAEIPREMLVRGEWIVPSLQGEPSLDKPPL